jgi:hypothetical protein
MILEQMQAVPLELVEAQAWQLELANDMERALSDDAVVHLPWANAVVAVDLFTLASPIGWKTGQTADERFYALQAHFQGVIADAVATLRAEVGSGVRDPVGNFRKRVQAGMRRHYYDAYALGRQQSDPYWSGFDAGNLEAVRGLIETEYGYLRSFCENLRALLAGGQPLPGTIEVRASMYGASLRNAYQMGIADGARQGDTISITAGPVKEAHCSTCPSRWGVYSRAQYEALGPPPTNWCEGISNCKCIVTVHHQIAPDVRYTMDLVKTLGELERFRVPGFMEGWRGCQLPVTGCR